ncbi:hypothetical protein [Patiriisocius sp. Uisw_017]|jgi:hypothetical protein
MKTKDTSLDQVKVQPQRNTVLAVYMFSIMTLVLSYAAYLAQVHLA